MFHGLLIPLFTGSLIYWLMVNCSWFSGLLIHGILDSLTHYSFTHSLTQFLFVLEFIRFLLVNLPDPRKGAC